jgi:hypothetical protein
MYDFKKQLAKGAEGEELIRQHFQKEWIITPSTMADQKRGIDFYFQHRRNDISCTVEVKSDKKASSTGNGFFEIYSAFPNKRGWAYTCQADYFFYLLPQDRLIYVFRPKLFSKLLKLWGHYPTRNIRNKSWVTRGHLVPLHEFENHASQIINF